jgi:hypothetical protein
VNGTTDQPLPTKRELVRATLIAVAVAGTVLATTVLPAEYGIDPLGTGRALGLDKLSASSIESVQIVPSANATALERTALSRADTQLRRDTLTVVVPAYDGIELKADMKAGQSLAFDWHTDSAALYTDMHGEPPNPAENEFTSYWKEKEQSSGRGTLVAPFDGTHGWYWQNNTENPVTVTVDASGFYQDIHEKK